MLREEDLLTISTTNAKNYVKQRVKQVQVQLELLLSVKSFLARLYIARELHNKLYQ